MKSLVTIRGATLDDERFLYEVQREGMLPVSDADVGPKVDEETSYKSYLSNFNPKEIKVIVCDHIPVGRLKVVRDDQRIYIGAIQILIAYQRRGIGTFIFSELIEESKVTGLPIKLEVHDVNVAAQTFYTKLGFVEDKIVDNKIHLIYRLLQQLTELLTHRQTSLVLSNFVTLTLL